MKKIILLLLLAGFYSCKKDNCKVCTENKSVITQYPYQHPVDEKKTSEKFTFCTGEEIKKAEEAKTDTAEGHDPNFPYIKTGVITIRKSDCK